MALFPVSFFSPFAIPAMAAYMWFQSAATGEGFGMPYQYSKRKISAMSNEEFNMMDGAKIAEISLSDIRAYVDALPEFFLEARRVNVMFLKELTHLWKDAVDFGFEMVGSNFSGAPSPETGVQPNPDYVPEPDKFLPPIAGTDSLPPTKKTPPKKPSPTGDQRGAEIMKRQIDDLEEKMLNQKRIVDVHYPNPDDKGRSAKEHRGRLTDMINALYKKRLEFKKKYGYWY